MTNNGCNITFANYKEKIKTIFSTPYILKCHIAEQYERYQDIFLIPQIKKMLNSNEIIESAEHFLDNNLNLTQAAKNSFMHRNTMIYRIKKIEKITGLNIKLFDNAQIFSNLLIIYNILKNRMI